MLGFFWLVNLLKMLLGGKQAGVQQAQATENREASLQRVDDRLAYTLASVRRDNFHKADQILQADGKLW